MSEILNWNGGLDSERPSIFAPPKSQSQRLGTENLPNLELLKRSSVHETFTKEAGKFLFGRQTSATEAPLKSEGISRDIPRTAEGYPKGSSRDLKGFQGIYVVF